LWETQVEAEKKEIKNRKKKKNIYSTGVGGDKTIPIHIMKVLYSFRVFIVRKIYAIQLGL
jgi:hypothetical protein